jgi:hypothetical protein
MNRLKIINSIVLLITVILFISISGCASISAEKEIQYNRGLFFERMLIRSVFGSTETSSAQNQYAIDVSRIGFNPDDSTAILQAAFDSGASYILVPKMDSPWISDQLFVKSNTTIIFGEGAELLAKRGAFQGTSDALLNINDAENVTIFGYNASIRMYREDYRKAPYKKGEWRHTINANGCKNLFIFGIKTENSGGDGIYLGAGALTYNENVYIKDIILKNHYRQGISVISAEHLVIRDSEIVNTEGTAPSAGIDFEPNLATERLVDCNVSNCIITGNAGSGILIYLAQNDQTTTPFSIKVTDCTINGNLTSVFLWATDKHPRGELTLLGNKLCGFSWIPGSTKDITVINKP